MSDPSMFRSESVVLRLAETPALVLDCGSCVSRAGLAGDDSPRCVLPSVVATPRAGGAGASQQDVHCGEGALEQLKDPHLSPHLSRRQPVQYGHIVEWEHMEALWTHIFHQGLNRDPEEHPLVLLEPALSPTVTREKTAQVMFETFQVPALALVRRPEACLWSAGAGTSGLVVELGGMSCTPAPVWEGYVLSRCVVKSLLSGQELSWYMLRLLTDAGHVITGSPTEQLRLAEDVKERLCRVAPEPLQEKDSNSDQPGCSSTEETEEYPLPDGSIFSVGRERFLCPESIFQPPLRGEEMPGLHEIVHSAIRRCDPDLQPVMSANVLLCGAASLFPGLGDRFQAEMDKLAEVKAGDYKVKVTHIQDPHTAFRGGSRLAASEEFVHRYLTREFYEEYGPSAVVRHFI